MLYFNNVLLLPQMPFSSAVCFFNKDFFLLFHWRLTLKPPVLTDPRGYSHPE